jgi:hypothetical protein
MPGPGVLNGKAAEGRALPPQARCGGDSLPKPDPGDRVADGAPSSGRDPRGAARDERKSGARGIQTVVPDPEREEKLAMKTIRSIKAGEDKMLRDIARLPAMAKVLASDVAMKVTTDAVRLLRGYGYMTDIPVRKTTRDVKITQIHVGTNYGRCTRPASEPKSGCANEGDTAAPMRSTIPGPSCPGAGAFHPASRWNPPRLGLLARRHAPGPRLPERPGCRCAPAVLQRSNPASKPNRRGDRAGAASAPALPPVSIPSASTACELHRQTAAGPGKDLALDVNTKCRILIAAP